jgi:hypothetical protein
MDSKPDKELTKVEIDDKLKELTEEEVLFIVNMNNTIGSLDPYHFQEIINAIGKSLYILQKDALPRNVVNILTISNKLLTDIAILNRAEIICILYYLQQNIGTIQMNMESNEMPTWSIRDDVFKKMC